MVERRRSSCYGLSKITSTDSRLLTEKTEVRGPEGTAREEKQAYWLN